MKNIIFFCLLYISLGCAQSAVIQLSNGDTINADVIDANINNIKISHPVLGSINLPAQQVISIDGKTIAAETNKEPAIKTLVLDKSTPEEEVAENEANDGFSLSDLRLMKDWNHKFGGGINGKSGNTDTTIARIESRSSLENELRRWDIRSVYSYDSGDDTDAENEFYIETTHDWLRPGSPRFYFTGAKYEMDRYSNWDHKLTGTVGLGHEYIKRKDLLVLGRVGLVGRETVGGSDPGFNPEMMLGSEMRKSFSKVHSLNLKTAFYQSLTDSSWSNTSNLDWDIVLHQLWGLGLTIGLKNEYESDPDDGDVHNDFKYNLSFLWSWGPLN